MVWTDDEVWPNGKASPAVTPHFEPNAPLYDRVKTDSKGRVVYKKKGDTVTTEHQTEEGYVGKAKGMKQVLWERGLWKEDMIGVVDPEKDKQGRDHDLSMQHVLNACYDFATERTAFQLMLIDRGHIPEMSPKCHPEIAGVGIEYSWGKQKMHFRRHTDHVGAHLHKNIIESMEQCGLVRVRKYARKSREYRRAYKGNGEMDHAVIEKFVKTRKSHRGADAQDWAFIYAT
jgi:hypothetical protein